MRVRITGPPLGHCNGGQDWKSKVFEVFRMDGEFS